MSWPLVKLGDLCGVVTKGTTPTSLGMDFSTDGIPFLRIQNISDNSVSLNDILYIDEPTHEALKRSKIYAGDFLITIAGTIGRVAIVPDGFPESNCNQAVAVLRFDKSKLSERYLLHWLGTDSAINQISGRKVTATISNLSLGQIKELEIPLPPLTEQKRIAAILDKADAIRRKRQQAIQLTNDFLKSLFLNNGLSPLSVKIPENAEIKPGWKWVKLTDVARLESGHTPSRKMDEYWNGDVNWLSLKDIKNIGSMYIYDTSDKPTQLGIDNSSARLLPAGTVALCRTASVGKCVILGREMATSQDFVDWVCSDQITPEFLYTVIRCSSREFDKLKQGSTHKTIYMPIVKEFCILLPPISIQKKISRIMAWVENRLITLKENEADCAHLFKSLSQEAFAGKL